MEILPINDIQAISALLEMEQLPSGDVAPGPLMPFFGAMDNDKLAGVIGCELRDHCALLRSLVVVDTYRGCGVAAQLINAVERIAYSVGVQSMYLLTTDAENYFARYGYQAIERDQVPSAIRQTEQFSSLCPDSATVMIKSLA